MTICHDCNEYFTCTHKKYYGDGSCSGGSNKNNLNLCRCPKCYFSYHEKDPDIMAISLLRVFRRCFPEAIKEFPILTKKIVAEIL